MTSTEAIFHFMQGAKSSRLATAGLYIAVLPYLFRGYMSRSVFIRPVIGVTCRVPMARDFDYLTKVVKPKSIALVNLALNIMACNCHSLIWGSKGKVIYCFTLAPGVKF